MKRAVHRNIILKNNTLPFMWNIPKKLTIDESKTDSITTRKERIKTEFLIRPCKLL